MIGYQALYDGTELSVDPFRPDLVAACSIITSQKGEYDIASKAAGVPWLIIAGIHFRESTLRFDKHLHNGDPLSDRTVHVPVGRPVKAPAWGHMPYAWHESASDALSSAWKPSVWNLPTALEFCERYNGLGYQIKHAINTPYLWSCTTAYSSGLYVSDGSFDPNAQDHRPGVAAIWKALQIRGVKLDFTN